MWARATTGVRRCGTVEPDQHLQALDGAGSAFGDLAGAAAADTPVPTCPGWDVQELVRHLGKVHRWAATIVGTPLQRPLRFDPFEARPPVAEGELVPWYREGQGALVRTLREAPPDLDCWSFLPAPTPLAFWCRRQSHETVIHLADLAVAHDRPPDSPGWEIPPAFAADGIDELLRGWMRGRPADAGEVEAPSLRIVGTDHDLDWVLSFPGPRDLTLTPGPRASSRPACTVRARAVDLYLLLWNRRSAEGLDVEGDAAVVGQWTAGHQVH
jgi:uncharacterized protein (TIGR03083 family)